MSFQDDFKAALVDELNSEWDGGAYGSIYPENIVDIRVSWDSGDRYDPTYLGDAIVPGFEVEVVFTCGGNEFCRRVNTAWTFTALLRAVLAIGDHEKEARKS